ncbi:MFS transporter [Thermomonospora cellulosilytica]|uniref:MFS family permease n=1 Tax=Thermomonospora cellulosilytica TaxID=1411118 RepID=A0A7W3R7D7_9ACTN|nr:MFS transporter [Thermomonospora cellulosilytica]MBA9002567.1 MFS family permease [Thermomonospora cellulosilytica]
MSTTDARMDGRAWGVLFVLCGAIFLEGIDVAMLNVALPSIRADLGLSTGMLSGLVSAYVLGYGGFMLLGGRAADLLGRRRMFLLWLTVFCLFSGLGGLATEGWMLLVARFVTGVAAAFMAPAGLALLTGAFPEGPLRTRALGVYAGTAAGGFSLGLVAGGLLASLGWRWVFFAPVIMSAVILAAAIPLVKDTDAAGERQGGFDLPGAFAITGAMLLLVYGVVRLEHPSRGPGLTAAVLAAGLALLAAFVLIERRAADPLVRPGILRSGTLVRTNAAALLFIGAFGGFQFLLTLYLQEVRGWSTLETGLAMLVIAIDTVLAPTLTPRLVNRYGNVRVLFGGLVLAAVAYALFLPVGADWTYAAMLPSLIVLGLAFSLAYGPLTMAAVEGVPEEEHGLASGLLYTAIQFGTALGLSAVTAVNVAALGSGTALEAIRAALVVPLAAAVLAAVITAFGLRTRPAPAPVVAPVAVPDPEVVR